MSSLVLGAAAGGGFPQWNSNQVSCRRARSHDPKVKPRSQASVAVSADDENWFLLNAAPDLRQQIEATPALHPRQGLRHSPIAGVVLTNGDVDAVAGLLTLRERHGFTVWATPRVLSVLSGNSIFDVLTSDTVARIPLPIDREIPLTLPGGAPSGLHCVAFAVPGKVPLYLETDDTPAIAENDTTIGVMVAAGASRMFFVPSCASITPALAERLRGAPLVYFDGTLWRDDEMIVAGLGAKTGLRMGHISMSGPDGAIAGLADLGIGRKVFLHINNSNPVLLEDSPEHAEARAHGWEIAEDGMEIML